MLRCIDHRGGENLRADPLDLFCNVNVKRRAKIKVPTLSFLELLQITSVLIGTFERHVKNVEASIVKPAQGGVSKVALVSRLFIVVNHTQY